MQPYKLHVLLIGYRYIHQMIKVWVYWNNNVVKVTVYVLLKQNRHVTSAAWQNKRHSILITAKQQSL